MGRKSIKENKNIYQLSREEAGFTREAASEKMEIISDDRIEKIESRKSLPHADEILLLADCYKKPELYNYFCVHECPIGEKIVPEIKQEELPQIVLKMLSLFNSIEKDKDRMIEIAADGEISEEEMNDFVAIQEKLEGISHAVNSLKLWVAKRMAEGRM